MRQERPLIAVSFLSLFAGVILRLAEPWPLKWVLDRIVPTTRPAGLNSLPTIETLDTSTLLTLCAVGIVALGGLRALSDYSQRIALAKMGNRVLRRVRNHVYTHVQSLSLAFHNRARSGDLLVRVTRDVSLLRDVTSTAMLPMLGNVLIFVGMLGIMLALQWQLGLVAMATLPLFWISTIRIGRGIHDAARKQRAREGAMAATASESITAMRDVQALALEGAFAGDFASRNNLSQKEDLKAARLSAKLGRTVDILLAVSTALVLWYGGYRVLGGNMTPGDLLVFLTYLRRAFRPAKDFAKHAARLAKAAAAGDRVLALLEQTPEIRDLPGATEADRFRGAIAFEGVGFGYEPDHPVLDRVDIQAEPGQFIALTGPSGSGKSTLVSLLLRLYDPTHGQIRVDGRDIREITLASLRSQVSVVLQDTVLFTGSLRDNIGCGAPDAGENEIVEAARLANADGFIRALPEGYDTLVGERGATLSQGQRQRIAIARAALRRAPILLLDEPTTGLDERNERDVVAGLARVSRGATTLVVTHDLRLAELADLVLYLDRGRIVECGSPAELLEAGLAYAELHHLQTNRRHRDSRAS
jgi:ATP-binding cassette subfamily B protein